MDYIYLIFFVVVLILILIGSIDKHFNPAKFIVLILLTFLLPGLIALFLDSLNLFVHGDAIKNVLIGFGIGIVLYIIVLRRFNYLATFEHEFTHAVFALLFFNKITKFVVTRNRGGYVSYSGGYGGQFAQFIIALAPYFFPTFSFIFTLTRSLFGPNWFPWYDIFLGITLIYQFIGNFEEIGQNWSSSTFYVAGTKKLTLTDIASVGYIFSTVFILSMTLIFYASIFYILAGNVKPFIDILLLIWHKSLAFYQPVYYVIFGYLQSGI